MSILVDLYIQFLIIGATAFGGGYAVLPLIQSFVVEEKGWLNVAEMTDLVSISNMTPGPIAINSATFVGAKVAGIPGSIFATMGVVTPSFIIMAILGYVLFKTAKKLNFLENMLKTLRPAIVGLIAVASIDMAKNSLLEESITSQFITLNTVPFICFVVGLVLYYKKFPLTKLIGLGAVMGIALSIIL